MWCDTSCLSHRDVDPGGTKQVVDARSTPEEHEYMQELTNITTDLLDRVQMTPRTANRTCSSLQSKRDTNQQYRPRPTAIVWPVFLEIHHLVVHLNRSEYTRQNMRGCP